MTKTTVIHVRDMQPGDVYIGRAMPRRGLKASKWANPFKMGGPLDRTREDVINLYRDMLMGDSSYLLKDLHELKGKRLACWCSPEACHGDVLAEMADAT